MKHPRSLLINFIDTNYKIGGPDGSSSLRLFLDLVVVILVFFGLTLTTILGTGEDISSVTKIVLTICFGAIGFTVLITLLVLLMRALRQ